MWKVVSKNLVSGIVGLVFISLLFLFIHLKKEAANSVLEVDEVVRVQCPIATQACLIDLVGGMKIEVSLSPGGLPMLKPLILKLTSNQINFKKIKGFEASFKGLDMDMGSHLLALDPTISSGVLIATGLLPLCPMDPEMVWVLNIKFQYQNKVTLLSFEVPSGS
jgi:hypothetical protein